MKEIQRSFWYGSSLGKSCYKHHGKIAASTLEIFYVCAIVLSDDNSKN